MRFEWPWVTRWTFEKVRRENVLLKDALHQANQEIRRHRFLLGEIQTGRKETLELLDRLHS